MNDDLLPEQKLFRAIIQDAFDCVFSEKSSEYDRRQSLAMLTDTSGAFAQMRDDYSLIAGLCPDKVKASAERILATENPYRTYLKIKGSASS